MKLRILYTGITGLIGRYFYETDPDPENHEILGIGRTNRPNWSTRGLYGFQTCDIADRERFHEILWTFKPDVVVHAAGEGNVDSVEKNPGLYASTSMQFLAFLLEETKTLKSRLVHFSSNAVYDGEHAPYGEGAPLHPVNAYGKQKAEMDAEVRRYTGDWVILRPIVCYGWNFPFARPNPISSFMPKILSGQKLRVVDDQWENPVYAGDVAGALWKCLDVGFSGELNVAGGDDAVNRYDWITIAANVFGRPHAEIERAKMSDFSAGAPRPRNTTFDITRLRNELHYNPKTVEEGALAMKEDIRRTHLK